MFVELKSESSWSPILITYCKTKNWIFILYYTLGKLIAFINYLRPHKAYTYPGISIFKLFSTYKISFILYACKLSGLRPILLKILF